MISKSSMGSSQRLVTGYNHNIPYGVVYHVQTEFYPGDSAHVDTHVFDHGRVVGFHRSDVDIEVEGADEGVLHVMKAQQKEMIRHLISGTLSAPKVEKAQSRAETASPIARAGRASMIGRDSAPESEHSVANLELRRSLIRFVRAVQPENTPDDEQLLDRLRSVITTIAVILGRHVYDNSRHEELAELLILRSEGLDWLRVRPNIADERGHRLWAGFAQIARRFGRLNQRRELVDHDRQVWGRVLSALRSLPDSAPIERDVLESLKSTWGRDEELDALTEFPLGLDSGTLRRAVEAARERVPISDGVESSSRSELVPRES